MVQCLIMEEYNRCVSGKTTKIAFKLCARLQCEKNISLLKVKTARMYFVYTKVHYVGAKIHFSTEYFPMSF